MQKDAAEKIRKAFNLPEADVLSRSMGSQGMDIILSDRARKVFPFAVECKNQERFNIWEAIKQSQQNAEGLTPLVVFARNHEDTYCSLRFDDLLSLLSPQLTILDFPAQAINAIAKDPDDRVLVIPMERGTKIIK